MTDSNIWYVSRVGIRNTQLNYKKVRRTIERKKNQPHPKEPTIEEINDAFTDPEIMSKYGYTLDGDAKFYLDTVVETDYKFTIFLSEYVQEFIGQNIAVGCRLYLIDGTFDKLPLDYYQLLTLSVEYLNDVSYCPIRPFIYLLTCTFQCQNFSTI